MGGRSNLPPGVTPGMIPGNRPEDFEDEAAAEHLLNELAGEKLMPEEYALVAAIAKGGLLAAVREHVKARVAQAHEEAQMGQPTNWDEWAELQKAWRAVQAAALRGGEGKDAVEKAVELIDTILSQH